MNARRFRVRVEVLAVAQILLGAATVLRPSATVSARTGGRGTSPDARIVRVLGARQVVQGVITIAHPRAEIVRTGAVLDAAHAASLLPFIAFSPRYRIPALVSGLLAVAAAVAGSRTVGEGTP